MQKLTNLRRATRSADRLLRAAGYVARVDTPRRLPQSIQLETTTACNLTCPMCPRAYSTGLGHAMPSALVTRVLREFAEGGGEMVYLYGLGEPLCDRRIFDIVDEAHDHGLAVVISTNATLLDDARRRRMLASRVEHVIAAIDGVTAETYEFYRTGGDFDEVVDNVRSFAALKYATGSDSTLVVQMIRMERNWHEADAFVREWGRLPGVDLVRLKNEDIGIEGHRIAPVDGENRKNPCHLLWDGPITVRATGDVYACYHIAEVEPESPLGNVADSSLMGLWNGPRMRELRALNKRLDFKPGSACATCPCVRPRFPFILGSMAGGGVTTRWMVPVAERLASKYPWVLFESSPAEGPVRAKTDQKPI